VVGRGGCGGGGGCEVLLLAEVAGGCPMLGLAKVAAVLEVGGGEAGWRWRWLLALGDDVKGGGGAGGWGVGGGGVGGGDKAGEGKTVAGLPGLRCWCRLRTLALLRAAAGGWVVSLKLRAAAAVGGEAATAHGV
jgi:hypothetical protein